MHVVASSQLMDAPISMHKRMTNSNKIGTNWWERIVVQRSSHAIDSLVERLTKRSSFLTEACPPMTAASMAELNREEVREGALLGRGTYSEVYEVADLELSSSDDDDNHKENSMSGTSGQDVVVGLLARAARQTLQKQVREGRQYAIKHLKPDLLRDPKAFESAAADLIMEARFMGMLSHPNILKMTAVAMGGTAAYACSGLFDAFFIIVERLDETLDERLRQWRRGSANKHLGDNNYSSPVLKMNLALQLGSALVHLHDRRLVYRDLKPHNCGLTKEGNLKLFDFGFCRELPLNDSGLACTGTMYNDVSNDIQAWHRQNDHVYDNRLYGMSGKGTLMYMSPEVLGTRRYNQKADVYSWSLILYEMLTLKRPYNIESVETHRHAIFSRGERPPLYNCGIPKPLQNLLENAWHGDVARRFTMHEAVTHLQDIISDSNQPAPLSRADSFDICLSTASSIFWDSLETLWNTVVNDFRMGRDHHECRESDILDSCIVPGSNMHIECVHGQSTVIISPENAELKDSAASNNNDHNGPYLRKTPSSHINGDDVPVDRIRSIHHGTPSHRPSHHNDNCHNVARPLLGKAVGDRYYKDRLLRSIHTVHRHYRIGSGPAPPNQVVSPSA